MDGEIDRKTSNELKPVAAYAQHLPAVGLGRGLWERIQEFICKPSAKGAEIQWNLIGRYMDAFLRDDTDPLQLVKGSEAGKDYIRKFGNYYIQLSLIVFQAEHLIREEVERLGLDYPFQKRSQLIKMLMLEDCMTELCKQLSTFYESPSASEMEQTAEILSHFLDGAVKFAGKAQPTGTDTLTHNKAEKQIQKMANLLDKTSNVGYEPNKFRFWNELCLRVFGANRQQISGYAAFETALHTAAVPVKGTFKKYGYNMGEFSEYPGRGKGKKTAAAS